MFTQVLDICFALIAGKLKKFKKPHMDQNVRLLHWLWMSLQNMQDYISMAIYRCGQIQKIHLNYRTRITGRKLLMPILQGVRVFMSAGAISLLEYYFRDNGERLQRYSQKHRFHILYWLWFYIIAGIIVNCRANEIDTGD